MPSVRRSRACSPPARNSARSQGAVLKLANLGSKFKEVLQVTKLMTVFDTYDNEAAAVASFAK
jgi:anti-sigma B factor antagonist